MKCSIYNNYITLSTAYGLIYNSYTNMYVIVRMKQYDAFHSLPIEQLAEQFPKLYSQLLKAGCIVEDNANEVQCLLERIRQIDNQDANYALTVNPTMNCNFKCWYCYENHLAHSKMSNEVLERTKKHISSVLAAKHWTKFHLGFFGGEPLLYYKEVVRPLIMHLLQECAKHDVSYSIGFTSNGYLLTDLMVDELKSFNVSSFQITLDGGKEAHNLVRYPYAGADTYTRIVDNIKKLLRAQISVVLRINYTAATLATVKAIVPDFSSLQNEEMKYLQVDFHRVWQDSDNEQHMFDPKLLDECRAAFEECGIRVSVPIMDQVNNSCYADKTHQSLINYNGDVYKCTARDFNKVNRLGVLTEDGTIEWDEGKMNAREGVRLSKEVCRCCRIAPLCGGTCTQRGLDSGDSNLCIRGLEEKGKDNVVLNQFYYSVVKNEVSL